MSYLENMGRGATRVRRVIASYLETTLPNLIVVARDNWELDKYQLPLPTSYKEVEPYALDHFPSVGVSVTSAGNFNRSDYTSRLEEKYLVTYNVRVFTWVRTPTDSADLTFKPEYAETVRLRDDMAALIRAAFLLSPTLNDPTVLWDEDTLSEEYSEITPVKGDRFVGGVIHDFEIRVDESLSRNTLGEFDTLIIDDVVAYGANEAFIPYVTPEDM